MGIKKRNIVVIGSTKSGKTTLSEAILFTAGAIEKMGRVDEGNSVSDYEPEEKERGLTFINKVNSFTWQDYSINLLDTPGYPDFIEEVRSALSVVENGIVVVDGEAGLDAQSDRVWKMAETIKPKIVFINKLDKEGVNFERLLSELKKRFSENIIPVIFPLKTDTLEGVVDIIGERAYFKDKEGNIPPERAEDVSKWRTALIEKIVELDDKLMEKYLEGEELSQEELKECLRGGVIQGKIIPLFAGVAIENIGVPSLVNFFELLMAPEEKGEISAKKEDGSEVQVKLSDDEPFLAQVFKTLSEPHLGDLSFIRVYAGSVSSGASIYNSSSRTKERVRQIVKTFGKDRKPCEKLTAGEIGCLVKLKETKTGDTLCSESLSVSLPPLEIGEPIISFSVTPKKKTDEEKISAALSKFAAEDLGFRVTRDTATKELILSGMGDLHLEIMIKRLHRRYGVEATLGKPRIAYKETIRATAKAQGKYKKQTGGRGQYGDVWLEIQPLEREKEFEFIDKIFGGAIPSKFIPSVQKGVEDALREGVLAGYPVVNVKVILYDGSFHPVDSSDIAFKIAASMAFKKAMELAQPVLLEPTMLVEVLTPKDTTGDVTSDLNSRRGKILGIDAREDAQFVRAHVPLAEMYKYASTLRSITQNRGSYVMKFSHYQEVPAFLTEKIIEEAKSKKGKGE